MQCRRRRERAKAVAAGRHGVSRGGSWQPASHGREKSGNARFLPAHGLHRKRRGFLLSPTTQGTPRPPPSRDKMADTVRSLAGGRRWKLGARWTSRAFTFRHVITLLPPVATRGGRSRVMKGRRLIGPGVPRSIFRTVNLGVNAADDRLDSPPFLFADDGCRLLPEELLSLPFHDSLAL